MHLNRAIPVLLALAIPAMGWEVNYMVTVDSQSPRYALPTEDLTQLQGGGQNNVRYSVYSFLAPFTGLFAFSSIGLSGWDNYLVLYRTSFQPNTPLVNAVAANDNNPVVGRAGFSAVLTGGEQYFVVTSSAFNGGGSFSAANTVTGIPEPSTWATLLGGVALCAHQSRRKERTE